MDRPGESNAGRFDLRARDADFATRDHLAFGIGGRGRDAELEGREVALVGVEADLRELGRGAEAQRQQPGCERIERAGVAGLLGAVQPLGLLQRTSSVQTSWSPPMMSMA